MKIKIKIIALLCASFLSAGCSLFSNVPAVGGVVKTVDKGKSWRFFNQVKDQPEASLSGVSVSKLMFSPGSATTLYAGSYNTGLLVSEDNATTWRSILSKIAVYDFFVDPLNPQIIYACGSFGDRGKIVRTQDGGGSWDEVYNEAALNNVVRSITLGGRGEIYGALTNGNIVVSVDRGDTWKLVYNFQTKVNRIEYKLGKVYALTQVGGLYASSDMGNTFNDVSPDLKSNQFFLSLQRDTVSSFNQFYIGKTGQLFVTTNNGLYESHNAGASWNLVTIPAYKKELNFYAFTQSEQESNTWYLAVSDTLFQSSDAGKNWRSWNLGTAGFANAIIGDPKQPDVAYAGIYIGK